MPEVYRPSHHAKATHSRYNLVQSGRVITGDWSEYDVHGRQIRRLVSCVQPADENLYNISKDLHTAGLVAGELVHKHANQRIFSIPWLRPLALEARMGVQDEMRSLSDHKMIEELGNLTAEISRVSGGLIIAGPRAEELIGIVEFVAEEQRQLLALPGIEAALVRPTADPVSSPTELAHEQMLSFGPRFVERFSDYGNSFVDGYLRGNGE